MNNYFGIGLDAKISLEFNNKRDEHPKKCRYTKTHTQEVFQQGSLTTGLTPLTVTRISFVP